MKTYLANLMWDALLIFCTRLHDYIFDPERAARIRFAHRERWWQYKLRAEQTKSKRDDLRAKWWATMFDFKTNPTAALARGDLDQHARDIAMKAVEETRSKMSGYHQP